MEPLFVTQRSFRPEYQIVWPNEQDNFNLESVRLRTYENWPVSFVMPQELASNGFVYLKRQDRVQCCFCNRILCDWEPGDIPAHEHRKHSPLCPFVRDPCSTDNLSIRDASLGLTQPARRRVVNVSSFDVCGSRPSDVNASPLSQQRKSQPRRVLKELNIIPHFEPKFSSYVTRVARLKSYDTWPKAMPQDKKELAAAGLFYTGMSDQVMCFQCGVSLRDWVASDVPFVEHAFWNPKCPYVNLIKGKEFIKRVRKQKQAATANDNKTSDEIEVQNEDTTEEEASNIPGAITGAETSKVEVSEDITTFTASCDPRMSSSSQDDTSEETSLNACKVCLTQEKSVVFLPCRHLLACVQCAAELSKCPVCRAAIKGKVPTYLA